MPFGQSPAEPMEVETYTQDLAQALFHVSWGRILFDSKHPNTNAYIASMLCWGACLKQIDMVKVPLLGIESAESLHAYQFSRVTDLPHMHAR